MFRSREIDRTAKCYRVNLRMSTGFLKIVCFHILSILCFRSAIIHHRLPPELSEIRLWRISLHAHGKCLSAAILIVCSRRHNLQCSCEHSDCLNVEDNLLKRGTGPTRIERIYIRCKPDAEYRICCMLQSYCLLMFRSPDINRT